MCDDAGQVAVLSAHAGLVRHKAGRLWRLWLLGLEVARVEEALPHHGVSLAPASEAALCGPGELARHGAFPVLTAHSRDLRLEHREVRTLGYTFWYHSGSIWDVRVGIKL